MAEIAQNIKLKDRDPEELKTKLLRVVELVTSIKGNKANIAQFTKCLTEEKASLVKNQTELKALEKECFSRTRKPRALKSKLQNPAKPRKERKNKKADKVPGKDIDISSGLKPGETAPGDPRQAGLPIDKK